MHRSEVRFQSKTGLIAASGAEPIWRIRLHLQPDVRVHCGTRSGSRLETFKAMCHRRLDQGNGLERSVLTFQKLVTSRRPLFKRPW